MAEEEGGGSEEEDVSVNRNTLQAILNKLIALDMKVGYNHNVISFIHCLQVSKLPMKIEMEKAILDLSANCKQPDYRKQKTMEVSSLVNLTQIFFN